MPGDESAHPIPSPAERDAAAVASVLGSDDLVPLVLFRLGFPTSLVRAALVCRRWYRIASHPDFLRRFRELHPPGVLGFYSDLVFSGRPQFVPLVEAPELATVIRRSSALDGKIVISDCRHGRLLVSCFDGHQHVLHPLHPTRGAAVIPIPSLLTGDFTCFCCWFFLPEDGSKDGAIIVEAFNGDGRFHAEVTTFQSGTWTDRIKVKAQIGPEASHSVKDVLPPVHGKIYMNTDSSPGCILELDLVAASVSVVQLPDRVNTNNFKISCGEDSGLSLVHADGSLLSIWHLRMSDDGSFDWDLVDDAICVREAYNCQEGVTVFVVDNNLEYCRGRR